jgi:ubiquinone/menaquinone biosynthesis C-methylase UbiE
MHLDAIVVNELLKSVQLTGKVIVDFGCGTGRNWEKIFQGKPAQLIGVDVSARMLNVLQRKYPDSKTFLIKNNALKDLADKSCNLILCNLVIGYIENLSENISEWNRVLATSADVIITDFHPVPLQKGADRSFKCQNQMVYVKNYIHTLEQVRLHAARRHWTEIQFLERNIDEEVKGFFKNEEALKIYERDFNMPLVYGFHFQTKNQLLPG